MRYRQIFKKYYGTIPKDEDGRSYEIHHIDGNHKNDSPENLKAVTIQEHYNIHYAQEDWSACLKISQRMHLTPEEISKLAAMSAQQRVANGTHHFLDSELQRRKSQKRVEDGTHNFLGGEIQKQTNLRRVADGSHHLLRRTDGSSVASDLVANGTHHFLGSENTKKQLKNGTHQSQQKKICEHCGKTTGSSMYSRWHGNNCKLYQCTV